MGRRSLSCSRRTKVPCVNLVLFFVAEAGARLHEYVGSRKHHSKGSCARLPVVMDPGSEEETFHWSNCAARLRELAESSSLALEPRGRFFVAEGLRVTPPLVFPIPESMQAEARPPDSAKESAARQARRLEGQTIESLVGIQRYLQTLPQEPGLQVLILMQAGAAALGVFDGGEVLATKTLKRYVVRGKGRAQPAHLATKGKSRYGSRLRLMNARLLLEEINEKLMEFWERFGTPEQVYVSAPKGLWPELFRAKTEPPFAADQAIIRMPFDLPVPKTEVLMQAYRFLGRGRIEWLTGGSIPE